MFKLSSRVCLVAVLSAGWVACDSSNDAADMGKADGGKNDAGAGDSGEPAKDAGTSPTSGAKPLIPTTTETCPKLATGTIKVLGQNVQLWVGDKQATKKGAVFFYWHGTGSHSSEAMTGLGAAIDEITAEGGIVASFETSTKKGDTVVGDPPYDVWFPGDYEMADVILACAVKQLNIDTTRIYTGGCSAGGLAAGTMAYLRSSYIAAAMPNSGGIVRPFRLEDPDHVPAIMTTHGSFSADVVSLHFKTTSLDAASDLSAQGGLAVDCEHSAGHCQAPAAVVKAQWEFVKAHPFGVTKDPYADGLPSDFPAYCSIVKGSKTQMAGRKCFATSECGAGNSCCFTQGPEMSNLRGAMSSCKPSGAVTKPFGRCSAAYELCAADTDCGDGMTCFGEPDGYCR